MKSLYACVIICVVVLTVGCAAPEKTLNQDVTYDFDVNVDFSRVSLYNWVKLPASSRIDQFDQLRIKDAVNSQLETKGLKVDIKKPDVYLVIYGGDYKAVDMTAIMDYKVYYVGRLKLAMYDARSHQEIWWGETRADLYHELTPEQKDNVIATAVQNIFKYYPPRP